MTQTSIIIGIEFAQLIEIVQNIAQLRRELLFFCFKIKILLNLENGGFVLVTALKRFPAFSAFGDDASSRFLPYGVASFRSVSSSAKLRSADSLKLQEIVV